MYVWHGTLDFVLIWSILNFLGITLEGLARAAASRLAGGVGGRPGLAGSRAGRPA